MNKAPPAVTKKARPLPGEEYETAKPPRAVTNRHDEFRSRGNRSRRRRPKPSQPAAVESTPVEPDSIAVRGGKSRLTHGRS